MAQISLVASSEAKVLVLGESGTCKELIARAINLARQQARCGNLQLTGEQMHRLKNYDWPGNVRELQNVIECAMILSRCGVQALNLNLILPDD